jgi:hypothetical protein
VHTVLHSFNHAEKYGPEASLIFDAVGNLYGTIGGGTYGYGTVFEITTQLQLRNQINGHRGNEILPLHWWGFPVSALPPISHVNDNSQDVCEGRLLAAESTPAGHQNALVNWRT